MLEWAAEIFLSSPFATRRTHRKKAVLKLYKNGAYPKASPGARIVQSTAKLWDMLFFICTAFFCASAFLRKALLLIELVF